MTDEEKAEESLISYRKEPKWKGKIFMQDENTSYKDGFLVGLKAGRPQLHDLRKDPNDLPKDDDEKLCFYEKGKVIARYDSSYSCWETYFNNLETVIASNVIIAWCELPQFTDKE